MGSDFKLLLRRKVIACLAHLCETQPERVLGDSGVRSTMIDLISKVATDGFSLDDLGDALELAGRSPGCSTSIDWISWN